MAGTGTPRDDSPHAALPDAVLGDAAPPVDAPPVDAVLPADGSPVAGSPAGTAAAPVRDDVVTATLRRSPKYTMFLLAGAALGVVIALILTTAFPGTQLPSESGYTYSAGQVFGFLTLFCVPVGLAGGGIVALIIDRSSARRARELTVGRERFRDDG